MEISVIRIKPINFSILNSNEQESIVYRFQKFLNSIDFKVQILVTTNKLELSSYFESLEKRVKQVIKKTNNKTYVNTFNSYKEHILTTIKENKVVNREFYIILQDNSSVNLEIKSKLIESSLNNLGLQNFRLGNEELKSLLINFFNHNYKDKNPENPVTKDSLFHYLIAPTTINNYKNYLKIDDKYSRIISSIGYPRNVELGFLDKLITLKGNFDISIHIEPYSIDSTMIMLNKQLQKQRADLYSINLKNSINPSLEIKYNDTRKVLENLQKGEEKLFNVSLYINVKADSLEELNLLTKNIQSQLNSIMIVPKINDFKQVQGLKSCLPFSIDDLKVKRNITTNPLSAFFPFTSQFLEIENSGTLLGLNKNNIPIIKDIFNFTNPNSIVLATSGSGKSFYSKLFISRQLLNGTKVMVIDPQSEYIKLAEKFQGQVITISKDSSTIINPLDLLNHDYNEKRLSLIDLFSVMLGELTEPQKAILDKCLTKTYERKGIFNKEKTWKNKPPILQDLLYELTKSEKKATMLEKPTYQSLINRLSMYVDGVFSFLNKQTSLNFNNNFVVFNIGDMPKQVKPTIMFLILDYVYTKMKSNLERKILVVDEAWSLLSRTEDSQYIFEIVKTSRKFNLGLLLLTQDVQDLINSRAGNAVLSNSSYTLLLKQKPAVIDSITKTFHLSTNERNKLLTVNIGEGILILDNEHTELKVIASPEEYKIITTKPDELIKPVKVVNENVEKKEVSIKVDESLGFFRKSSINQDELEFLINNGYVLSSHVNLTSKKQEDFLLKPRDNETVDHFFLVKAIEEELRNYTDKIQLFQTVKPDILFKDKSNNLYAIEVETGLNKKRKGLEKKVNLLNSQLKDKWFFVVTNKDVKRTYEKLGKTLTRFEVVQELNKIFGFQPNLNEQSQNLPLNHVSRKNIKNILRNNS